MKSFRRFILILALLQTVLYGYGYKIHCAEDSVKVVELLTVVGEQGGTLGDRVVAAAKSLAGIPKGEGVYKDSITELQINFHQLDNLEFINTSLALAKASLRAEPSIKIFAEELEGVSRLKGQDTDFSSLPFYGSIWILDNISRGNLKEMTEYLPGGSFRTKTFDHLTRNRDQYPAMAEEAVFDKVRMQEMGYRSNRVPHMKKQSVSNKSLHELLKNGDIIMMLSSEPDYDIYDIGIIEMREGVPYLIHLPSREGLVTIDEYPLPRLFKIENQHFYGYRWLSPAD